MAAPPLHPSLSEAAPRSFWHDRERPEPERPPASGVTTADLAIIGGGFTGLWAAVQAAEDDPGRRIVVLEAERVAHGASGRNGGFIDGSITHGLENGVKHWPDEIDTLLRLGDESWQGMLDTFDRHRVGAGFEPVGSLDVAVEPWQVDDIAESAALLRAHGRDVVTLSADELRAEVASPAYLGGLWRPTSNGLIDPVRLADELARVAESLGVVIHERTRVTGLDETAAGVEVRTPGGTHRVDRVLIATNAYPDPTRRIRRYVIPVYDYVLVTEPLDAPQRLSIGWARRQGIGDGGNQFHYYRLTDDDRILWGGYDAVYHFANRVDDALDQRDASHGALAEHFFATFPQLEGLRFTHRWGGPIATTSRFTVAFGRSRRGRVAWAAGYTGLGVGASRFGARVGLDLLAGADTECTRLSMVRRKPFPFPPEPLRWASVEVTRRAIARADRHDGRRGPWLRLLDRFGVGFDS